mgnify:CR=1 FL=1
MDLYKSRFSERTSDIAHKFNSSIKTDYRLYPYDIKGSIAHAKMLCECSIISSEDCDLIVSGLESILEDLNNGKLEISYESEDIHMFIESELTKRIGNSGKKLHTARSRNDQVALDLKLYTKDKTEEAVLYIKNLISTILKISQDNLNTVMPGYTHLQIAQPVTFAHHIMAYAQMFMRDLQRIQDLSNRLDISPLGACALATTTYNIDRFSTAEKLGFSKVTLNSIDSVSDRDFVVDFIYCLAMFSMHLSRLAEELIIFSSQEFNYIKISDKYSSGSSIMPQKKNPDMAELLRAKSAKMYSNLMGILTMLKAIPLAYNKDMQEDKIYLFESVEIFEISVEIITNILETMQVDKFRMREMASKGYINATDAADYLVKKGLTFRDSYYIIGEIVKYAISEDLSLNDISLEKYQEFSNKFDEDYFHFIDLDYILNQRDVFSGPSPKRVQEQINIVKEKLDDSKKWLNKRAF